MPPGGEVVLVCDYEELAHDMCGHFDKLDDIFERNPSRSAPGEEVKWLSRHPLPAKSEREAVCEIKWRDVYRCIYTRK
jgi:hypothetical protein